MKTGIFALCLLILVLQIEARRRVLGGRGGYTTPRSNRNRYSHGSTTQRHRYTTESSYGHSNAFNTGNSNPAPSAPLNPGNNRPDIGFENVHNRVPNQPGNQPPIGFNVPPQNSNQPSYHPPNYNNPGNYNPYSPPGGHYPNQPSYHPPNYNNPGNYNPGGYHPNYYSQGSFSGGYQGNPHLAQPGSYYNPNFGAHTPGFSPPIYQPVQQSSGVGSILGIAGSFAGGYLIGRLTSGGHDSSGNGYTVHHYYNNANEVPKKLSVANSGLVTCSQNETQNLCVPNTFPVCLVNGTIMCVTHAAYTVSCGSNSSLPCVVSALPCAKDSANCSSSANLSTTVVFVPCISNVTIGGSKKLDSGIPSNETSTKFCVTAIAEPKMQELSAIGSYLALMTNLAGAPLFNITTSSPMGAPNSSIISNSTLQSSNTTKPNSTMELSNSTMMGVSTTMDSYSNTMNSFNSTIELVNSTIIPLNNTLESFTSTMEINSTSLITTTQIPITNHTDVIYVRS